MANNEFGPQDQIATTVCNDCGQRGPAVVYHRNGVRVGAECRHCAPERFEQFARRDIDNWLSAGR